MILLRVGGLLSFPPPALRFAVFGLGPFITVHPALEPEVVVMGLNNGSGHRRRLSFLDGSRAECCWRRGICVGGDEMEEGAKKDEDVRKLHFTKVEMPEAGSMRQRIIRNFSFER